MRETETEESHRYNSETKPIHAQDLQLLRYGSWVWIMGYGSHAVPGYGSEPYILSCSHIVQYIYIYISPENGMMIVRFAPKQSQIVTITIYNHYKL